MEQLTHDLANKSWQLIEEIEQLGGMTKAIEGGIPKMRIEQSAAKKQGLIDSGKQVIVGINKFTTQKESEIEILEIDNNAVRKLQVEKLRTIKSSRNEKVVQEHLNNIVEAAKATLSKVTESAATKNKSQNLLALAVKAARSRATLGEISQALESVFGRYTAHSQTVSGVYKKETESNKNYQEASKLSELFAEQEGRRPRILIAKMGQDGHDRGARVIASGYADLGFDVDIAPLFQTPKEVAKQAMENDVHIIGVSSLAGGHKTLVSQLFHELKLYDDTNFLVVVGGVIPKQDYEALYSKGVSAIFGPGSSIADTAIIILKLLMNKDK